MKTPTDGNETTRLGLERRVWWQVVSGAVTENYSQDADIFTLADGFRSSVGFTGANHRITESRAVNHSIAEPPPEPPLSQHWGV